MKLILLGIFLTLTAWGVPEKIELVDGRTLEKVTAVDMEDDKIRITHESGISRLSLEKITATSLRAIGVQTFAAALENPLASVTRLETLDGKIYEGVRNVKIKPSFISFGHDGGAVSVRFENLGEPIRQLCRYDKQVADEFDKAKAAAEAAMAKAEMDQERKVARAQMAADQRQRRQQAIWELEMLSYGDEHYWGSGQRGRMLQDAIMQRNLQQSGFSSYEASQLMNRKRFR